MPSEVHPCQARFLVSSRCLSFRRSVPFLLMIGIAVSLILWRQGKAEETAGEQNRRIARLIEDLGAHSFRQREQASSALESLGTSGRRGLHEALEAENLEVRLRAADLLRRLAEEALWAESRLSFACENENISTALERLSALSGNTIFVGQRYGSFEEAAVTVEMDRASPWQILHELCRQSNNHLRPHYNPRQPGLVLTSGAPGGNPTAVCGPVLARLTGARKQYEEHLDYQDGSSDIAQEFQLSMQLLWEDRFRLIAYRPAPQVLGATTDTGAELAAAKPQAGGWNSAGPGVRQLTTKLHLQPPPRAARRLSELRLSWEMIAVGEMHTVAIDELIPGKRYRQGDIEVQVQEIEPRTGDRFHIQVLISRDLLIPEPGDSITHENELQFFDQNGNPLLLQGQSSTLAQQGVRISATVQVHNKNSQPSRLVVTYPLIRSQRDLEIVFRDVPLPVSQPR